MALTAAQYANMRVRLCVALAGGYGIATMSDAELNGFINQLNSDGAALGAISGVTQSFADTRALIRLSGHSTNPGLADIAVFWTQATADASGAAALTLSRYQYLRTELANLLGVTYDDAARYVNAYGGFGGNFGALMPGVVEYRRADLGLSLTSTIVNSWANQAGSAGTMTENTAAAGIGSVGSGVGGRASIQQNGTNQGGNYALTLAAPATTAVMFYWVARNPSIATGNPTLFGDKSANSIVVYRGAGTDALNMFAGASGPAVAATAHAWHRGAAFFTGSTSDVIKWGNVNQVTGTSSGNTASSTPRTFGYSFQNAAFLPDEWALVLVGTGVTSATYAATLAALDAATSSWFGAGNVLL